MRALILILCVSGLSSTALGAKNCRSKVETIANQLSEVRVALMYADLSTPEFKDLRNEYSQKAIELISETDRVDRCLGLHVSEVSE